MIDFEATRLRKVQEDHDRQLEKSELDAWVEELRKEALKMPDDIEIKRVNNFMYIAQSRLYPWNKSDIERLSEQITGFQVKVLFPHVLTFQVTDDQEWHRFQELLQLCNLPF